MFKDAIIHGLKVAGHILASLIIVALGYFLTTGSPQLVQLFIHYGLPVGLVNILIATALKMFQDSSILI